MRTIMKMTFAGEDAEVLTVTNGDDAVAKAKAAAPDLIFADVSMAGLDGYEVARAVRADPALANTAVIVMASQHHPYDEARAKACGVDDHILKPFDSKLLIEKANAVVTSRRTGVPTGPAPVAAPPPAAVAPAVAESAPKPPAPPQPRPVQPIAAPPAPVVAAPAPRVAVPAPTAARTVRNTMAFDTSNAAAAAPDAAFAPVSNTRRSAPPPPPGAPVPAARVTSGYGDLSTKLAGLGLSADQVAGVLALSREVIEQVVWEVVPELAEAMIKEEIKRLTAD
jgi:CheY-like chemotaxis protein